MRRLFIIVVSSLGCSSSGDPAAIDGAVARDGSVADAAVADAAVVSDGGIDGAVADAAADAAAVDAANAPDANVGPDATPNSDLSFFVTSTGSGAGGGNLGGLVGADAKCQALGNSGGAGSRVWRAYLSTGSTGPGSAVSARDRIGTGPWTSAVGASVAASVADLHNDGLPEAAMLDELGNVVPSNEHDILTGSASDGTISSDSETCDNWTNGTDGSQAQVGHADWETRGPDGESWNSQHSGDCTEAGLAGNAGAGRIYCFASD